MLSYLLWLETLDDDEREVFSRIFIEFSPRIKYIAWRLTHNNEDAEDIVGSVFERVMIHKEKFLKANDKEIYRLLVIYARSIFFDEEKRKKKVSFETYDYTSSDFIERQIEFEDEDASVLEKLIRKETATILRKKVDELGEPAATIMHLTYYAEYSSSEISRILDINASTVRTIIQKSREKLKVELEEYINGTDK